MFSNVDEARGALVDALLSGKYEKTEGKLCRQTPDGLTYCAQGVALEVLRQNGYPVEFRFPPGWSYAHVDSEGGTATGYLPEWAENVFGLDGIGIAADNDGFSLDSSDAFPLSFADIAANLKNGKYDRGEPS